MISAVDRLSRPLPRLNRALENRARLHLGDLGIADGQAHAAEAEHRIEFVQLRRTRAQFLRAHPHRLGHLIDLVVRFRQEFMQRRIEKANRDRQPGHDLEQLGEILALHGQQLGERRAPSRFVSARIISRTATMRSPSKNMCSVRQRPMPSAPKLRAARASAGVSALARTFIRLDAIRPAHQGREIAGHFGLHHRRCAPHDLSGAAVNGEDVAFFERHSADRHRLCAHSRCGSRRRRKRRACPCRAPRPRHGKSCRRVSSRSLRAACMP